MRKSSKSNLKSCILGILLTVVMIVAGSSVYMLEVKAEGEIVGDGIPELESMEPVDGVYEIQTAGQLYWFAALVNGSLTDGSGNKVQDSDADAKLMTHITVNQGMLSVDEQGIVRFGGSDPVYTWIPIGDNNTGYQGTFDGNGWSISGLYINNSETKYAGLFGKVAADASVLEVTVSDSYMSTSKSTGLIAGYNAGTIENCGNSNSKVIGSSINVGGIAGENYLGTITCCFNTSDIKSTGRYVGGIVGYNSGTVIKCHNTGSVESGTMDAGGVAGSNKGSVINCYNTGEVLAESAADGKFVGGVAGSNFRGSITNCYNIGIVKAGKYLSGGISGNNDGGTVTNCYYLAGCAKDGNDVVQNGIGKESFGATTTDVAGSTTSVTTEQLASGEITYKLNSGKTDGTQAWYQYLDGYGYRNNTPVLKDAITVFQVEKYDCPNDLSGVVAYNNSPEDIRSTTHKDSDSDGVCDICEVLVGVEPAYIDGVYQIGNREHLYWFSGLISGTLDGVIQDVTANAVLTADIELNSGEMAVAQDGTVTFGGNAPVYTWTPIGRLRKEYCGTFDGNGKKVTGIYFDDESAEYVGLFGALEAGAEVRNLGVENSYLNGWNNIGGVVGYKNGGSVINCYNKAHVNGKNNIGGVVGYNDDGYVKNCYNEGVVCGKEEMVGGVVGNSYVSYGSITDCYNMAPVTGNGYVGGVVGISQWTTVEDCYNLGNVIGTEYVGGVIGCMDGYSIVNNCYYLTETATDGKNMQYGIGASQDNTTADTAGKTASVTATQLTSGELTFLLNDATSIGELTWYQTIGTDSYPVLNAGRGIVYERYECDGTTVRYRNVAEDVPHIDENNDDYCDVCEGISNDIGAQLTGHSVSLSEKVGVSFYMELTPEVLADDTAYMEFTLPGGSKIKQYLSEASTEEIGGKTYYIFTGSVAAKEMSDDIQAQMVCSDGNGGTKRGSIYHYSVKEYAEALVNAPFATEEEKALAKAMLNYGAYAQTYFNYNTRILANAGLAENVLLELSAEDKNDLRNCKPAVTGENDILTYAGSALALEADIKVRHYFRLKDDATYDMNLGLTEYIPQGGIWGDSITGTYYYWESAGISVSQLAGMTNYTGVTGITISYCPLSYVTTAVLNTEGELLYDDNLQNLMKALYLYYKAATN